MGPILRLLFIYNGKIAIRQCLNGFKSFVSKRKLHETINTILLPLSKDSQRPFATQKRGGNELTEMGKLNFNCEVEDALNEQIFCEMEASHVYLSMCCYFARSDVALPGAEGFFKEMHEEEHTHALIFIEYMNLRGGHVKLRSISAPKVSNWKSIMNSLSVALEMEKYVTNKILCLNQIAEKHKDVSCTNFLTEKFIDEQDKSVKELARLIVRLTKMGNSGLADFFFDLELHKAIRKKMGGKDKPYL